ncbi:MAG: redox-regulated ATPase YchF [Nitrososphaerota archaeon]|jgi:ribosome-binding ATPase YchF (GTP1/OBG family)|nr:redox-regulated ATPase YchF [Nitrososphaerota archaeon]MDG6942206.1 redox-regulated ATPase YchF [Nitrososphaerota archaeon]MDG6942671.1 redox-regulated ATPase YchF [Nitrososphaerota archaeon]MDG6948458.1 redox-regulated ATPase YchF [Nitrososphaerota archaeon]MDG6950384.1 redox-regulated ATPase YchF [Nitrososphaerota archaeon]
MLVGVVGKPNVGKSTFFAAATLKDVQIADYPFTTVKPNVGVAHLVTQCVCHEMGVVDSPRNSSCVHGSRLVPVKVVDVAGLVEGASKGKGLGNQFLDDLRQADALIHVVDASGSTDLEGRKIPPGTHDPVEDIGMVEHEFDLWMFDILKRDWEKAARSLEQTGGKVVDHLAERLSGLSVTLTDVEDAVLRLHLRTEKPSTWSDDQIMQLVVEIRKLTKPSLVAANKADLPTSPRNIEKLRETGRVVVPCASEAELLLRRAAERNLVTYTPGDRTFAISDPGRLTGAQAAALRMVEERVMRVYGGTGVQEAVNKAFFGLLNAIVVFPVEDETKLTDKAGRVLPDAFVMRGGSTAIDLARTVHSDLAEGFLYAVDARTGKRLSADYVLKNRDVLKIVSSGKRG